MSVRYNIVERGNPVKPEEPKKFYPSIQSSSRMTLRQLAEQAADRSTLTTADILAAVESWGKQDLDALNKEWSKRVERIAKIVETVPGVSTEIRIPEGGNSYPTLTVKWDESAWGFSVADCDKALRDGEPRIEVLTNSNPSLVPAVHEGWQAGRKETPSRPNRLQIISMTLQDGEELIVGRRLKEILGKAAAAKKA